MNINERMEEIVRAVEEHQSNMMIYSDYYGVVSLYCAFQCDSKTIKKGIEEHHPDCIVNKAIKLVEDLDNAKKLEKKRYDPSLRRCPTCGQPAVGMERSPDGNTWCANNHKHPHAEFYPE